MTPQLPDISEEQRAVLERIYESFRAGSPWPTFGQLDREFDRKGIDLPQVLGAIPLAYALLDRNRLFDPRPDMELKLSLFGIARCPDSEDDVALFFDALQWLGTVEVEHVIDPDDPSTVEVVATAAAFNEHLSSTSWGASPINVCKVRMLLQHEPPGVWQTFGGSSDEWTASLRRGIRKYRNVASLDDYLSIIGEVAPQLFGLGTAWAASPASLSAPPGAAESTPRPANAMTDAEITRVVNRYIGVSGGYLGDFSYRTHADFYPEYCDLEIDPYAVDGTTRERFIAILSSLTPRDQAKVLRGVIERFPPDQGPDARQVAHAGLLKVIKRLESAGPLIVGATPQITSEVVLRALRDAENLIQTSGPTSAVDRVHTVLHGYLQAVCDGEGIAYKRDDSMVALFKKLRLGHPRLADLGPRGQDVEKVLKSCANILDAFLPVRNQASVAHPNQELLDEPEARLVINVGRSLLHYLDSKLS
jgi:hypothetical protein